jgi:uncharacterized protein (DUF885 family)
MPTAASAEAAPTQPRTQDQLLLEYLDEAFEEAGRLSPESRTSLGSRDGYGKLDDYTEAGGEASLRLAERQFATMKRRFRSAKLSPSSRLSYRLFGYRLRQLRLAQRWNRHSYPATTLSSPATRLPSFMIDQHRMESIEDARSYVSRLTEFERVMKEVAARIRSQTAAGIVPPKLIFQPVREDAQKVITGAPFDSGPDSILLSDFKNKLAALSADPLEKQRLLEATETALKGPLKRGYGAFLSALAEAEPRATGNNGVWSLPRGRAYYNALIRLYSTTALSADEVHRLGLDEVARIHRKMEMTKKRAGFKGTLHQFFAAVKADPRSRYPDDEAGRQAFFADARTLVAKVMAVAPRMFRKMPEAPLEVRPVEPHRQRTSPVAFYAPPVPDGSLPGIYYINVGDLRRVQKLQVRPITFHEGVPGHHFQIALAQSLSGLPKFRRFERYDAFTEGWGLYAERLGDELVPPETPYEEFGSLSMELLRAVRLVVDTGLHVRRWTREQAKDYFKEATPLEEGYIVQQVDRYLVTPGQALTYKLGELEILELRARAELELGDRFDPRDFHDALLSSGSLPLGLVAEQVEAYIKTSLRRPARRRESKVRRGRSSSSLRRRTLPPRDVAEAPSCRSTPPRQGRICEDQAWHVPPYANLC